MAETTAKIKVDTTEFNKALESMRKALAEMTAAMRGLRREADLAGMSARRMREEIERMPEPEQHDGMDTSTTSGGLPNP
jgi:hypothetical protein